MQKLKIFCQLIHDLGLKKVYWDDHKIMEFNFDGFGVHFINKDFALITRLKLNAHTKYFIFKEVSKDLDEWLTSIFWECIDRIVEDLDNFNCYPWGSYIYKMMVKLVCGTFIKSELDEMQNLTKKCDLKAFPALLK